MLRSILSVVGAYLVMGALILLADLALAVALPTWFPEPPPHHPPMPARTEAYLLVIGLGFPIGVAGGYLCTLWARTSPMRHAGALAELLGVLLLVTVLTGHTNPAPLWYWLGLGTAGAGGVMAGAGYRRHRLALRQRRDTAPGSPPDTPRS